MKIAIGSDHAAVALRIDLVQWLTQLGHDVGDFGPPPDVAVDYPAQAELVGAAVVGGAAERGILLCGTGIGMSIAANKLPGIRAALVHDIFTARMAAAHNRANVLCLGGRMLAPTHAREIVAEWLRTPFEERHQPRINLIARLECDRRPS